MTTQTTHEKIATGDRKTGRVVGVNGNLASVRFDTTVMQNEVAYVLVGKDRLKGEVIRVRGQEADVQIFEDTRGITVGDAVTFSGELLSVQLGPGLLTRVFDGLQNPLPQLAEVSGFFLQRGLYLEPLDHEHQWPFTPGVEAGHTVRAGDAVGTVPEGPILHRIMVPFGWTGTWQLTWVAPSGYLAVDAPVARASNGREEREITMVQAWPVKIPIAAYRQKLLPTEPLVTQTRAIDTFFPVAKGGTFCIPGPFGAGKTVLQHALSRHSEVDVVIVAACGERAGEVVEILTEFPELEDPRTGRSLIDRTIIICNTSSMPVAARETSIYTSVTLAEYYRQMGLHVLLLADSTSRWAQALREMSGRLEEIPGEEAFPAYLETRIAQFYERSGLVELNDGSVGSVTIGGAVSPAGGNFEEPVTQGTLKVVGGFLGLSRDRANARRYPAIHPLDSWSQYKSVVHHETVGRARDILRQGNEIHQMMKVVGEEGTPVEDFTVYLKSEFLDAVYLQQNSFDDVDAACSAERQSYVFKKVLAVLEREFPFASHAEARTFFMNLRQRFIDWNYTPWGGKAFKEGEKNIDAFLEEKRTA
ncbi:MAG: V-type ATP synthase subunit A [Syntrophotalea sp.]|jgi:V/A-type H+-transporting ATPase subunit A|uniref:V-type ATP synthase subunit A n=1 Tax=Syntrophotalea sp. TaxID=2812029 RepID=UPI003D0BF16B